MSGRTVSAEWRTSSKRTTKQTEAEAKQEADLLEWARRLMGSRDVRCLLRALTISSQDQTSSLSKIDPTNTVLIAKKQGQIALVEWIHSDAFKKFLAENAKDVAEPSEIPEVILNDSRPEPATNRPRRHARPVR
jgi:hypothetical protein